MPACPQKWCSSWPACWLQAGFGLLGGKRGRLLSGGATPATWPVIGSSSEEFSGDIVSDEHEAADVYVLEGYASAPFGRRLWWCLCVGTLLAILVCIL